MSAIKWIEQDVTVAIHDEQIILHGGLGGLRDEGLLQSALMRPKHVYTYETQDIHTLGATYGQGILRNHPFLDGNKRTALLVTYTFLNINGLHLTADEISTTHIILELAQGTKTRKAFIDFLKAHTQQVIP